MTIKIEVGNLWRCNGVTYEVIHIANKHGDSRRPITIVYKDSSGGIWAKDINSFLTSMTLYQE